MDYITEVDILEESKDNFLTYAEEVLTDRAIPSAEDGLLSAQRKILWTMEDYLKMSNKSKTKKCNAIVGSTLATSYYHGDISCYGVLCKLSQNFLMRYPLIEGQGSLGTQESNEMVASSRYTEAKPSQFADLMMNDFKKKVVPEKGTYNNEYMEPVVLPALFPNALCNGKQAIGISMAHNSLPNNLTEVCNAIIKYIQNDGLTIDELLEIMPGPDFPLGGTVINKKDIKTAFSTGKSSISLKVRGDYEIKDQEIIFTTIPYRTYRNKIKEQIEKNIDELENFIDDFNDESNLGKNKLIFHVKKGIAPDKALLKIFALTDLQTTVSYNMNYIVNGTPKLCSMLDLIKEYITHQTNVLLKATTFDKEKAEARKHILEGLLIAIGDIDTAIELIKNSSDKNEAEQKLINYFKITSIQAKAILDMKLAKLTKLDKNDLLSELDEKKKIIEECNKIITEKEYRNSVLINKIITMRDKYGDERRTKLLDIEVPKEEKEIAEVIPEDVVVILTQTGEIKRIPASSFKVQRRNGKGIKTEESAVLESISTNTIDTLMFFTNTGKMYKLLVDDIPTGTNTSKGIRVGSLINLEDNEKVVAMTSLHRKSKPQYVVFFTKQGLVKKTLLEEYMKVKRGKGTAAIKFKDNDSLANVLFMDEEEVVIVTKKGMSIHFSTKDIAAIGRVTSGVKAIKLDADDEVVIGLPIHKYSDNLAIFTTSGLGKKVSLEEMPYQGRSGKGVIVYKTSNSTGEIAGAAMIDKDDNILLVGKPGSICISANDIPLLNRVSLGNIMLKGKINSVVKL
jgi:DNA gyrase subunit A